MAPSLITSYFVTSAAASTAALVSPSFTPSIGEVIVVKVVTEDSTQTAAASTDTQSNAYTTRASVTTASHTFVSIRYAVTAAATAMTVSSGAFANGAGFNHKSMVVERWSNATLAATPAINVTTTGTGSPIQTLTTTAPNSVITWANGDWAAVAPGTPGYTANTTQENIDNQSPSFYVAYHCYTAVASTGVASFGISSPAGQTYSIIGMEVKDAGGAGAAVNGGEIEFVGSPKTTPFSLGLPRLRPLLVPKGQFRVATPASLQSTLDAITGDVVAPTTGNSNVSATANNATPIIASSTDLVPPHAGVTVTKFNMVTSTAAMAAWDIAKWTSTPLGLVLYNRFYLYLAAVPGATVGLTAHTTTGFTPSSSVRLTTARKLAAFQSGGTSLGTMNVPVPLDQWVRIETKTSMDVSAGTVEIRLFQNPESLVPDEDWVSSAGNTQSAQTGIDRVSIGNIGGGTTATHYFADVEWSDTTWIGPEPGFTVPPFIGFGVGVRV